MPWKYERCDSMGVLLCCIEGVIPKRNGYLHHEAQEERYRRGGRGRRSSKKLIYRDAWGLIKQNSSHLFSKFPKHTHATPWKQCYIPRTPQRREYFPRTCQGTSESHRTTKSNEREESKRAGRRERAPAEAQSSRSYSLFVCLNSPTDIRLTS